jgi:hypothetical protein
MPPPTRDYQDEHGKRLHVARVIPGYVQRQRKAWSRGGGLVVVRGRESRLHGEGVQRDKADERRKEGHS